MRFDKRVCLVTGGGSGIGKATCQRLASEGGRVAIIDLNLPHADEVAASIARSGGEAIALKADVSSATDVQHAISTAVAKWGGVDVVVNDAAMMTFQSLVELDEKKWDQVLAVNLKSVFLICKYALPHMKKGGAIVNVSSVHAHETEPNVSPYVASKGGMESLARALALECEKLKVRVNCVAPGAVNTPMLWNNPLVKSGQEKVKGAVGEPEDIAAAICFLASDEARFVNGTTLVVDGARLDIL